jgi:hypothetical protein
VAKTYRLYLLTVLFAFSIAWPTFATARYLYKISFCSLTYYSFGVNYVAYCGDKHFDDFEHQVFYEGTFDTDRRLREADVLFLGDSHIQYAFSHPNVAPFFAQRHARFFLAGLGYIEGWKFIDEVLKRHPPHPKILVINLDPFFTRPPSEPARYVLEHPLSSFVDAKFKGAVQPIYAALCRECGRSASLVRSRDSGQWNLLAFDPNNSVGQYPVTPNATPTDDSVSAWAALAEPEARELLADASARCVVFTDTPHDGRVGSYATRLAAQFNAIVILPELPGLRTYDTNHLDSQSAIAWSNAFLEQLDQIGSRCGAW